MKLSDLLPVEALTREVGWRIVLPRFGTLAAGEIRAKTAIDDLVTVADLEAEVALADGLRRLFPGCAVIGEESATPDFDYDSPELLFVIDPVDGTWPFAHGLPIFGVMTAVLSHGRTVGGLIHYPVTRDTLVVAAGEGVYHLRADGVSTRLPTLPQEARMVTGLIPLSLYKSQGRMELLRAFGDLSRIVTIQCSAHEYRMLAEDQADFCISTGLKPWDHHTGQLMLTELGGFAATVDGRQWPNVTGADRLISARNRATWERAAAALT
ncbi:inositol monophosphatase family protein [Falsirhodobacter xinxiangensis]|uniref:inositol monophosphatase family protein n=1 Tax=Falsirhodobacter xinxiangensis TaxID=2530049 RepID=UPI00145B4375|nr:inositol monophosphatase [Rhodobacter xinxiangensis]